jgi:hypothetical protein
MRRKRATSEAAEGSTANPSPATISLARRVSGWTSSLLATGIVLVAALGVGRQLVQWWRAEPADARRPAPAGPGVVGESGEQPFQLTFDNGYSLRRIELDGGLATATERLQSECRTILENAAAPTGPPTDGEQRFLARTLDRPPLEEQRGRWQIHQFDGKLPLMVAVRTNSPHEQPLESGLPNGRVVAWGLAMPTDEEVCTLLIYEAGGAAGVSSPREEIPLPSSLRRTVTLGGPQGETTIGLAGALSPRRTADELDRALAAEGWNPGPWRQAGSAWHNRYQVSRKARIDAQLTDDGRGGVVGLLIVHGEPLP